MGIFDIFKKSSDKGNRLTDASPEDKKNTPSDAVSQSASNSLELPSDSVPVPDGSSTGPRDSASSSNPVQTNPSVKWPVFGDSVSALVSDPELRVFVCASFMKQPAYSLFVEEWEKACSETSKKKFFFVPAFEKVKLSSEDKQSSQAAEMRTWDALNWNVCFRSMKEKNMNWTIVLLTGDSMDGYAAQRAAKEAGILLRWYGTNEQAKLTSLSRPKPSQRDDSVTSGSRQPPHRVAQFQIMNTVAAISRVNSSLLRVPAEGGTVLGVITNQRYTLMKPVMTDNASITYETSDPRFYAKIYTPKMLSIDLMEKKLDSMLKGRIDIPGVCWPVDKLTDGNGCFTGTLVPTSHGKQLSKTVLMGKNSLTNVFPSWDKRDLCRLAVTILEKVKKLEDEGVLFGYPNPSSIYVEDPEQVFFVDMDNWQIEGYPCLSRNQTFAPPEVLRSESKHILTTPDEEYYQVAVLLFMLLMPGKFPYAKKKTSDEIQSITDMAFPFKAKGRQGTRDAETPSGVWQMVWDHLSLKLRFKFNDVLARDGQSSQPGQRVKTSDWLYFTKAYLDELNEPANVESRTLFPSTFRRDGKRVFFKCSICGQEHPQEYFMHNIYIEKSKVDVWERGYRICLPCSNDQSNEGFTCECCKTTYYYTNRTKVLHEIGRLDFDYKQQRWCKDCKKKTQTCARCGREVPIFQMTAFEDRRRNLTQTVCGNCKRELIEEYNQWRNSTYTMVRCRFCGHSFEITNGDYEYFRAKGFNLPTRCKNCRGSR